MIGTPSFDRVPHVFVVMQRRPGGGLEGQAEVIGRKLRSFVASSCIGGIIADVYESVGKDGVVTVEKSKSSTTYYETTKGIKVDRGYASSLFINDQKRDECVLEDTYVLVCDGEIN